jgi:hypothetical protein
MKITQNVQKAVTKESRILASHIYLGMLIKRSLRQKRHIYMAMRRAKVNFTYEDRAIACEL